MNPPLRLALKLGTLFLAVAMLGGYLWYTQKRTTEPTPKFDPRVTSKSADMVFTKQDAAITPAATPASSPSNFQPPITSKSMAVFSDEDIAAAQAAANNTPAPRISSKVGAVFPPPAPAGTFGSASPSPSDQPTPPINP